LCLATLTARSCPSQHHCMRFKPHRPANRLKPLNSSPLYARRDICRTTYLVCAQLTAGGEAREDNGLKIDFNDREHRALGTAPVDRRALLIERTRDIAQTRATQQAAVLELSATASVLRQPTR
jgi:hypothetical protein